MHRCNKKRCVNPSHLKAAPPKENMAHRDIIKKNKKFIFWRG